MGIWLHSSLSFSIFWNVFLAPKTTYRKVLGDTVFPQDLRTQPGWQFHPAVCDQEATVRTGHGTTDWFQIGKGVRQGCILSLCLFNLHAGYNMQKAKMDEAQAGIKISGRNINNISYADDTTLMAESIEEIKSLLMKVKEESKKAGLKLNIQQLKIMASGPITSWEIDGETMETVRLYFLELQSHCR